MPSGVVHYKWFKRGYMFIVPSSLLLCFWDVRFGLGNLFGYSFHRYCDNDWDIMGVNEAEGRAVRELPVVGLYLFGVSSVYGAVFRKRHRKPETHWPYLSTIIRLLFVFAWPFITLYGYGINPLDWYVFWLGFWNGLSLADGIHWALDMRAKD